MFHLSLHARAGHPRCPDAGGPHRPMAGDRLSRALAAYVAIACLAGGAAVAVVVQDPRLLPEPAVALVEPAAPVEALGGDAGADGARAALERRAEAGDADAALALGRQLAAEARAGRNLGRASDAARWLDRARGLGRAEAAVELAALAERYCGWHELLADRLCAGD